MTWYGLTRWARPSYLYWKFTVKRYNEGVDVGHERSTALILEMLERAAGSKENKRLKPGIEEAYNLIRSGKQWDW